VLRSFQRSDLSRVSGWFREIDHPRSGPNRFTACGGSDSSPNDWS
jgi:hypothetical protein